MKQSLFILFLLPTLLFAQQDSLHKTFKIGAPRFLVAGWYGDKSTVLVSAIIKKPVISAHDVLDSAHIVSFTMSIGMGGSFYDFKSNNDRLTKPMLDILQQADSHSYVIFNNIRYVTYKDTLAGSGFVISLINTK